MLLINHASRSGSHAGGKHQLYDEADIFAAEIGTVTIRSIQQKFKVGYNLASFILEAMENNGIFKFVCDESVIE